MSDGHRYGILGQVSAWSCGQELTISTRRARTVLACLILHDGAVVGCESIMSAMYPERCPKTARNQVHRGALELRQKGIPIESHGQYYSLEVEREQVDTLHFEKLRDDAESAAAEGDLCSAMHLYSAALEIPRGDVLDGMEGPFFSPFEQFWKERILLTEEGYLRVALSAGMYEEVIPRLMFLRARWPLRESLTKYLMMALSRAGRSSEALSLYADHRDQMSATLGTDPSPDVQEVYMAILRNADAKALL